MLKLTVLCTFLFSSTLIALPLVKIAVKECEKDVVEYCQTITCPIYCKLNFNGKSKDLCLEKCGTEELCHLNGIALDSETSLDKQNREQLFACIAEKRDPTGTRSGRRTDITWQEIRTPSFSKKDPIKPCSIPNSSILPISHLFLHKNMRH